MYVVSLQVQSEVEETCVDVLDLANRRNFTLLSSFNCAIMCPTSVAHYVVDTFKHKGATLTQQGFVLHKDGHKQGKNIMAFVTTCSQLEYPEKNLSQQSNCQKNHSESHSTLACTLYTL